jgi:hypothetical protein
MFLILIFVRIVSFSKDFSMHYTLELCTFIHLEL